MLGKLAAAAATLVLTIPVGTAILTASGPPTCTPVGTHGPVADLDAEQASYARLIVNVGQQRGVPDQGLVIALMTAMQESTLRNLDYGDRDSLGLFQQRPSTGWGTPAHVRDPAYAAAAFYGGAESPTSNPGLLDIRGWQQLPLTAAAQAVQRSAFPDAYARWEDSARAWVAEILAAPAAAEPCAGAPVSGTAAEVIAAAARWLGTPYSWGGGDATGPTRGIAHGAGTVGFDCSGLTLHAYAQVGIELPRTSREHWYAPGGRVSAMTELQPGDLIFFAWNPADPRTIHHVAIWLGNDAMLEAPRTGDVVKVTENVSGNAYWAPKFIGGVRVL